jgi:REP element-mobilizing transposase RayT
MAVPLRHAHRAYVIAGARTFFVTSSISDRRNLLQSDRSAGLFIRVLYSYRAQGQFRLHEFVVMPDHFHTLLTVEGHMTIERATQFIKGGFAFRAGRELGFSARSGRRASQKCVSSMPTHSCEPAIISGTIRLPGILRPRLRYILTPQRIRDLSWTRRRRG